MNASQRKSERLDHILAVASQLFARQGYHATSTREIARIADVSENTLFRHFEQKEDLFWAALRFRLSSLKLRRELLDGLVQCSGPEVVLPQVLAQLVDTAALNPEILRLVAVAFIELRAKAAVVCQAHLSPIFSVIKSYLKANIEKGKLRDLDPAMITAALSMTVMAHPEIARIMDGAPPSYSDNKDAIRAYSKFWLEVLIPGQREQPGHVAGPV